MTGKYCLFGVKTSVVPPPLPNKSYLGVRRVMALPLLSLNPPHPWLCFFWSMSVVLEALGDVVLDCASDAFGSEIALTAPQMHDLPQAPLEEKGG